MSGISQRYDREFRAGTGRDVVKTNTGTGGLGSPVQPTAVATAGVKGSFKGSTPPPPQF